MPWRRRWVHRTDEDRRLAILADHKKCRYFAGYPRVEVGACRIVGSKTKMYEYKVAMERDIPDSRFPCVFHTERGTGYHYFDMDGHDLTYALEKHADSLDKRPSSDFGYRGLRYAEYRFERSVHVDKAAAAARQAEILESFGRQHAGHQEVQDALDWEFKYGFIVDARRNKKDNATTLVFAPKDDESMTDANGMMLWSRNFSDDGRDIGTEFNQASGSVWSEPDEKQLAVLFDEFGSDAQDDLFFI